ncbi:MAG: transposase [Hyphomonadaceae bacterium]|nr:transposase [Hyphomonadaceae bacterium]
MKYDWLQKWGLLLERIASDNVLRKIGALIDWRRVGWKVGKVRSQLGRSGYDVDLTLRVLLPGQWHSLSDRKLKEALRVRLDLMSFCGASLFENVPDPQDAPPFPLCASAVGVV